MITLNFAALKRIRRRGDRNIKSTMKFVKYFLKLKRNTNWCPSKLKRHRRRFRALKVRKRAKADPEGSTLSMLDAPGTENNHRSGLKTSVKIHKVKALVRD
jgi:hypothetical protein